MQLMCKQMEVRGENGEVWGLIEAEKKNTVIRNDLMKNRLLGHKVEDVYG